MHIGIDGYEANIKAPVGVGTFAGEVIRHIYQIDKYNSYTIFLPSNVNDLFPPERKQWRYRIIPSKGLWTFTSLPYGIWANQPKIDIFFSPTHYIPRFVGLPKVASIMDLSYLNYPDLFLKKDLYKLENWTNYTIKNAAKLITISEFTKKDIITHYKILAENITVAYPGFDKQRYRVLEKTMVNKRLNDLYNLNDKYILFVGTLQPRKNIKRLIRALAQTIGELKSVPKLVIVGKKGWLYQSIFELVSELKLNKFVKFLDYVPDEHMPYIYNGAQWLILPSLFEGFGLPIIESQACGVPTIVSNSSCLPEISGGASIYIDPEHTKSIACGILKALTLRPENKNILIKKGFKNIERFDWLICAQKILDVLNDTLILR